MKKVCARWIAHSMRSFQIVKDPGFKAVIDECLKIGKKYLYYYSSVFKKLQNCFFLLAGRELHPDTVLSSDDIISCDWTIKNEIIRLAVNERLLLKDRLLEAVMYGGLCIKNTRLEIIVNVSFT